VDGRGLLARRLIRMARSPLTFGISKLHGGSGPPLRDQAGRFTEVLQQRLGAEVSLVVCDDYDHQLAAVLAGNLDLAWLPPLSHARLTAEGARLLAVPERGGFLTCRAAILVAKVAPIWSLADLRGARAAWSTRLSSTGHVFPRIDLVSLGVDLRAESFYGGSATAFAAVASGEAELCACFVSSRSADPVLAAEEVARIHGPAVAPLRVLHVTDLIPPDGIVVGGSTSADDEGRIREALLSLHELPAGRAALLGLLRAQRLAGVTEALHATLRSWTELALSRQGSPVAASGTRS
jgi:phosphonate transport system substrate-binding protein